MVVVGLGVEDPPNVIPKGEEENTADDDTDDADDDNGGADEPNPPNAGLLPPNKPPPEAPDPVDDDEVVDDPKAEPNGKDEAVPDDVEGEAAELPKMPALPLPPPKRGNDDDVLGVKELLLNKDDVDVLPPLTGKTELNAEVFVEADDDDVGGMDENPRKDDVVGPDEKLKDCILEEDG